jgi:hypothetical protein
MLEAILSFMNTHATLVVSLIAVVLSLRSYLLARKALVLSTDNKSDADRIKLFEKRRELLSEVDTQHARMGTLLVVTAQQLILFNQHPWLRNEKPEGFARLKSNLDGVQELQSGYEEQRGGLEVIDTGADIARLDAILADIRRLTIHINEEITKEERELEVMRERIRTMARD